MIENEEDKEKRGKLNTNLPPSLENSEDCTIIEEPTTEALVQPPEAADEANSQAPDA